MPGVLVVEAMAQGGACLILNAPRRRRRLADLAGTALTGPLAALYKGKRVLVTGHTGFKGGWLATWLKMMGSRVTGFALPAEPVTPSFYESPPLAAGMNSAI